MAKTIYWYEHRSKKKAKTDFEKDFFKLMHNAVFGKTIENVRKHRDIKLVTTEERRNYLVSEPNYRTTKFFRENLLAIQIKKQRYFWINLSIWDFKVLELSKTLMYELWYDYVKPKFGAKVKLCYINTYSFIVYMKRRYLQRYCRRCWN